ncbi:MAG TPA: hypothetical protein VG055_14045 [Planctomycetaceae bacterium]|nr:hypothetical protein [Planctomycetaceae bacterium]
MIATARNPRRKACSRRRNDKFLGLLPTIRDQAEYAFRRVPVEAREELIQEVVAQAYALFVRLAKRRRLALAFATPLARFAIGNVRTGRRLGSRRNSREIMSSRACGTKGFIIERLDHFNLQTGQWCEALVEDRTAGPAQIAETRIDFADWLETLSNRDRELAETLARGETTGAVACMFRVSAARVSQLRRQLCENWHRFVGELTEVSGDGVMSAA